MLKMHPNIQVLSNFYYQINYLNSIDWQSQANESKSYRQEFGFLRQYSFPHFHNRKLGTFYFYSRQPTKYAKLPMSYFQCGWQRKVYGNWNLQINYLINRNYWQKQKLKIYLHVLKQHDFVTVVSLHIKTNCNLKLNISKNTRNIKIPFPIQSQSLTFVNVGNCQT